MKSNFFLIIGLFSFSVSGAENNISDSFNGNGSIGSVTINQQNYMTNEDVAAQERIDEALAYAYQQKSNGTPSKEANEKTLIADMANEINKTSGAMSQKNKLCKSKTDVSANILGYDLDFAFRTCDELFIVQ
ncbi:TPA: hypothetical protein ACRNQ3_002981 [Pseudomonas aeruginosa]